MTLSRSAQSVLTAINCRTPADLARKTEAQVRAAWRCGDKTTAELRAWLQEAGLDFFGKEEAKVVELPFVPIMEVPAGVTVTEEDVKEAVAAFVESKTVPKKFFEEGDVPFEQFAHECLKVQDKDGTTIPLVVTETQKAIIDSIKNVKVVDLKGHPPYDSPAFTANKIIVPADRWHHNMGTSHVVDHPCPCGKTHRIATWTISYFCDTDKQWRNVK